MYQEILELITHVANLPEDHEPTKEDLWDVLRRIETLAIQGNAEHAATMKRETIFGGVSRDTVLETFKHLDGAIPVCMIINHVTACDIDKFCDDHTDRAELVEKQVTRRRVEGVWAFVTTDRENLPDQHIRVLASNGRLYNFEIC